MMNLKEDKGVIRSGEVCLILPFHIIRYYMYKKTSNLTHVLQVIII